MLLRSREHGLSDSIWLTGIAWIEFWNRFAHFGHGFHNKPESSLVSSLRLSLGAPQLESLYFMSESLSSKLFTENCSFLFMQGCFFTLCIKLLTLCMWLIIKVILRRMSVRRRLQREQHGPEPLDWAKRGKRQRSCPRNASVWSDFFLFNTPTYFNQTKNPLQYFMSRFKRVILLNEFASGKEGNFFFTIREFEFF